MLCAMIMFIGLLVSAVAMVFALIEYRKERGCQREDEAMMRGWLSHSNEMIKNLGDQLIKNCIAKKNYKHLKRQIANRDGQITKLKKKLRFPAQASNNTGSGLK